MELENRSPKLMFMFLCTGARSRRSKIREPEYLVLIKISIQWVLETQWKKDTVGKHLRKTEHSGKTEQALVGEGVLHRKEGLELNQINEVSANREYGLAMG